MSSHDKAIADAQTLVRQIGNAIREQKTVIAQKQSREDLQLKIIEEARLKLWEEEQTLARLQHRQKLDNDLDELDAQDWDLKKAMKSLEKLVNGGRK